MNTSFFFKILFSLIYSNFINLVIALFLYNLGAGQEQPLN